MNGGSGRRWVWLSDVIQHSYRPRICYSNDTEPTDYIYRLIFSINFSYWFFLWPSLNLWFHVARFVPFHLSLIESLSCYNPPLDLLIFKFSTWIGTNKVRADVGLICCGFWFLDPEFGCLDLMRVWSVYLRSKHEGEFRSTPLPEIVYCQNFALRPPAKQRKKL